MNHPNFQISDNAYIWVISDNGVIVPHASPILICPAAGVLQHAAALTEAQHSAQTVPFLWFSVEANVNRD